MPILIKEDETSGFGGLLPNTDFKPNKDKHKNVYNLKTFNYIRAI